MSNHDASDIWLGLLGLMAAALFLGLHEDGVAVTLTVLGVACLVGSLQRLSAR